LSRLQPTFSDRVKYILQHTETGALTIPEPIGWKNDDNEFVRSKAMAGVMTQMTNNLQFTNQGRNFINSVRDVYGVNADLRMVKDERNPRTDEWTRVYSGFLDLSTWSEENSKVSVKFDSSGLLKLIKSRESEKIELDRLDTIDGKVLTALNKETVALNGRKIQLISRLETDSEFNEAFIRIEDDSKKTNQDILGIPLVEDFASNISIGQVPALRVENADTRTTSEPKARVENLFLADSKVESNISLSIKGSVNININRDAFFVENAVGQVRLVRYNNSTDYDFLEILHQQDIGNLDDNSDLIVAVDINLNFNILIGESLSFQVFIKAGLGSVIGQEGWIEYQLTNVDFTVNINEESFFEPTQAQFYLPHEIGDRLINVISDRNDAFYSTVLGRTDLNYSEDGEAALIGAANGFQIRGFEPEDELYKSFTTTWKDFRDTYLNTWNLGMGIELVGFQERVRIEKLEYFYNKNILIHIGANDENGKFQYTQVNNVKRTEAKDLYFSGLEFGNEKDIEYDEANGLDEYNSSSTFTTVINRVENKYVKKIKYNNSSYAPEFARRKQRKDTPTEDTKYDKVNFLMDLKRGVTDIFSQRFWQDDFTKEPTGVFSPDTAQNLRLSPFNTLLRHGWVIATGLIKYPSDYVRFGRSIANSNLSTQLIDGAEYAENGIIQNQSLESARYKPEFVEFEHEVSFDLLQQVQGKTVVLGEEIPNFHGLVAFRNENGQIEKGFLQNLKPNGNGKWKLLKYNN